MFITYNKNSTEPTTAIPEHSFEEFCNLLTHPQTLPHMPTFNSKQTYSTFYTPRLDPKHAAHIQKLNEAFEHTFKPTFDHYATLNITTQYSTFRIPKTSGGTRTINAPIEPFKSHLAHLNTFLQACKIYPHNCAYAYVPHRACKHAIEVHQKTKHTWFMKIDLHDFFGSCNPQFIKQQLTQIPFFNLMKPELLQQLIKICTLEIKPGKTGLPQGSPLSPWLTNQIMLPLDAKLNKACRTHNITYTRYADDMLFSANSKNCVQHAERLARETLQNTPLTINDEKTRISSIYGKNWNLGLMLNKDNNITVGYRNKERFRAAIHEFCLNWETWQPQETTELLGKLQYYLSIEPRYFHNMLNKYQTKFGFHPRHKMVEIIKARA